MIALATIDGNVPNVQMVNAYYEEGAIDERTKFESGRSKYSESVQKVYDGSKTYHDGKWLMFEPVDTSLFGDLMQILAIKRKPNRK